MSRLTDWLRRKFLVAEHAAESIVHQAEKELEMISQAFTDAIARIKAALASHVDDAKTISDLNAANAALQGQVNDLTQKLSDAASQIADMEQAAIDAAPPAPVV